VVRGDDNFDGHGLAFFPRHLDVADLSAVHALASSALGTIGLGVGGKSVARDG
jgi:hypothetical protein